MEEGLIGNAEFNLLRLSLVNPLIRVLVKEDSEIRNVT
jgi:hypothetical protein